MAQLRFVPALIALAATLGPAALQAQAWSPEQMEVWKVEQEQWRLYAAKDPTWIAKLVHPKASVWENTRPMPQNVASLEQWFRFNAAAAGKVLEQEFYPHAIVIVGNTAVVQYRYMIASENAKKEQEIEQGHWTDVLVREGGAWKFLTWAGGADPRK